MSEELEHSLRGPSGAHRWRRCPGSIRAEQGRPDNVGREAAAGTVFHRYAALCAVHDLDPHDFAIDKVLHFQDGYEIAFDEEMQDSMYAGLDWIRDNYIPEEDDLIYVETRVDISPWAGEGEFGTSDIIIIKRRARRIIVFDWKYGKGVAVSPIRNDQMYLYTLGVWNTVGWSHFGSPDDIKVTFVIEQPRHAGGGGTWETTMEEVLKEGEQIRIDAAETMNPDARRVPGEKQCLFCKASGDCREQAEYLLKVFGQKYDDLDPDEAPEFGDAEKVSAEARSFVILHWKAFKRWYEQLRLLAIRDIASGESVPLLKAINGRPGHRKYRPNYTQEVTKELVALLGEDKAFVTELVTPAVAEKALGKKAYRKHIHAYVEQPPGKVQLVPIGDKRPAIADFASKYAALENEADGEDDGDE